MESLRNRLVESLNTKIKTLDKTKGRKPNKDQHYTLTVEYKNGARYSYYGATKEEALKNLNEKIKSPKGFVKKEWDIKEKLSSVFKGGNEN